MPADMMRQILGERLNVGSVLTWGPDYYYQKQFFSGKDDPLSKPDRADALRPRSLGISLEPRRPHGSAGLKEQDYPGTKAH